MKNDIAYNNVDFIPDGASYPDRWAEEARAWREREAAVGRARLNHAYGPAERQKMDVFHPSGPAEGLVVFVHGGYWLRFHRDFWSHFAEGLTTRGWAVAMPSYTLAPNARISEITREAIRAVEGAAALVPGQIRLTGHSAGGHLVSRVLCPDASLDPEVRTRIKRLVPISPVADLRPLLDTTMNENLALDAAEAVAESPLLHPAPDVPVTVWVGAEERPAFLDQARWLAEAWGAEQRIAPGRHHFDVIDELREADSPLVNAILN
jgi:acetyl esterase/lipase